jgi:Rrf2 family protein
MIDLARYSEKEPVSIGSVAARQEISERYLEQLVALLKKAGLVKSIRGASGGYVLAKKPSEISVGDILRALEGRSNVRHLILQQEKAAWHRTDA